MILGWLDYKKTKRADIVDLIWTLNIGILTLFFFFISDGLFTRKLILLVLVLLWTVRLSSYIYRDRYKNPVEDRRYTALKNYWNHKNLDLKFLGFFLFQAALDVILTYSFYFIMNLKTELSIFDFLAIIIFFIGFFGVTVSDKQLEKFKNNPENKGNTCKQGLWNYSRHPNYFFEILIWFSYSLYLINTEHYIIAFLPGATILFFIITFTGIPATEKAAIKNRKGYKEYIETTSMIIPWFKKRK